MMTSQEAAAAAQSLREAGRLVSGVVQKLNARAHPCPECGLRKAEDFTQAQAHEQLEGVAEKLDRWAEALLRGERRRRRPR